MCPTSTIDCIAPSCKRRAHSRGVCQTHYTRLHGRGRGRGLGLAEPLQQGRHHSWPMWTIRPHKRYEQIRTPDGWIALHRHLFIRKFGVPVELVPCEDCELVMASLVHHEDRDTRNNVIRNLIGLCETCHAHIHGIEGARARWAS